MTEPTPADIAVAQAAINRILLAVWQDGDWDEFTHARLLEYGLIEEPAGAPPGAGYVLTLAASAALHGRCETPEIEGGEPSSPPRGDTAQPGARPPESAMLTAIGAAARTRHGGDDVRPVVTWLDKQAAQPDPVLSALRALDVYLPTRGPYEAMRLAIDAYETAEKLRLECDDPGCDAPASIGAPCGDGYRRTCAYHSVWDRPS